MPSIRADPCLEESGASLKSGGSFLPFWWDYFYGSIALSYYGCWIRLQVLMMRVYSRYTFLQ